MFFVFWLQCLCQLPASALSAAHVTVTLFRSHRFTLLCHFYFLSDFHHIQGPSSSTHKDWATSSLHSVVESGRSVLLRHGISIRCKKIVLIIYKKKYAYIVLWLAVTVGMLTVSSQIWQLECQYIWIPVRNPTHYSPVAFRWRDYYNACYFDYYYE